MSRLNNKLTTVASTSDNNLCKHSETYPSTISVALKILLQPQLPPLNFSHPQQKKKPGDFPRSAAYFQTHVLSKQFPPPKARQTGHVINVIIDTSMFVLAFVSSFFADAVAYPSTSIRAIKRGGRRVRYLPNRCDGRPGVKKYYFFPGSNAIFATTKTFPRVNDAIVLRKSS
jgi:hypothetical protein